MQFYFAVATATFIVFLMEAYTKDVTYSYAEDWAIDLLMRFIISLFWPLTLIGLAIETHNNIERN